MSGLSSYPNILIQDFDETENWIDILDIPSSPRNSQKEDFTNEEDSIQKAVSIAINDLSIKLCELISSNPNALASIEWRQLEHVIACALKGVGFTVELTPSSKDGGKDVIASFFVHGTKRTYFIEIKHWRSNKRVNSNYVFDFIEINLLEKTDGGLFISSSGYSQSVYSQLNELYRSTIRLGCVEKIVSLCQRFARKRKGLWQPIDDLSTVLFEKIINPSFTG